MSFFVDLKTHTRRGKGREGAVSKHFLEHYFVKKNLIFGTNFQDLANLIIFRGTFKDKITQTNFAKKYPAKS